MALALLALLGITALAVYRRRWGGLDLGTFLDRHPDAGPDVQRVLSAIRHEVLKHNTLMLGGLIESVRGGAATREAAEHILRAFFGDDGRGGVAPRLHAYIEQLDNLARAQGERLNLARRDPLVSALLEGLSRVRALQDTLLRADTLSPAARQQLAHALERADEALNRRGHAELRALLDRVRLLHVDAALLRQVFDRIRHEPALAGESIAELSVDVRSSLPCTLAMPRQAFDDILSNLFRNALQASLQHTRERPVIVGVAVELEADPITAIERVVLRVRDRVPSAPDREQLQHAYIEAGLGLTADLVARHAGSLDVASNEPGFAKAVVLRLPVDAGSES
jgi:signal transduction histidine kinase